MTVSVSKLILRIISLKTVYCDVVEWKYTAYGVGKTTKPRVDYLKLVKLNGEVIEIVFSGAEKIDLGRPYYLNDGAYMTTHFVISSSMLNLRL